MGTEGRGLLNTATVEDGNRETARGIFGVMAATKEAETIKKLNRTNPQHGPITLHEVWRVRRLTITPMRGGATFTKAWPFFYGRSLAMRPCREWGTLVCHPPACGPLGQVKGVTMPEFIRLGHRERLFALFSPLPRQHRLRIRPQALYPTLASLNPAQNEGAKARFSEPAATNRVGEVQTGNEYPPRACRRGRLPEWSGSSALPPAW